MHARDTERQDTPSSPAGTRDDVRTYPIDQLAVTAYVTQQVLDDAAVLDALLGEQRRKLDALAAERGMTVMGGVSVSVHREMFPRELPRRWWERLLRRPVRYAPPLHVLRVWAVAHGH